MAFAASHDTFNAAHADGHEPQTKQRRVATTATLLAVAVCGVLANGHLIATPAPSASAAAQQNLGTKPVTVVAPEFCKDQTWPYIDARCLRRVDNPKPVAPPAAVVDAKPAPDSAAANSVAAPPPAPTPPQAAAPSAEQGPPATATATGPQSQVIQSVFPTTDPAAANTGNTSGNVTADDSTTQRPSDVPQHRRVRHWNHHANNFFGFHF